MPPLAVRPATRNAGIMCGRFTQFYSWEGVYAFLNLFSEPRNLEPRYNLAPTQRAAVVRLDADGLNASPLP